MKKGRVKLGVLERLERRVLLDAAILDWSTLLGGGLEDLGLRSVRGGDGSLYVTGATESDDFPTSAGAWDTTQSGPNDIFVSKFAADGTLQWSTFVGGSSYDGATGIDVDSQGRVYLTGGTSSSDFPVTAGTFDTSYNGHLDPVIYVEGTPVYGDAFVLRLTADGTLDWATYLGGSLQDSAVDVAVDGSGNAYIAGATTSLFGFPTSAGAYDTTYNGSADSFVAKFDATGNRVWSTLFGGSGDEAMTTVALDGTGGLVVGGGTTSTNFPTTPGAIDGTHGGAYDGVVARFTTDGALSWSTYLGDTGAEIVGSLTVSDGAIYVTGGTESAGFPVSAGAPAHQGGTDIFLTRLDTAGAMTWSTLIGGSGDEGGAGVSVGPAGNVLVVGQTDSADFPVSPQAYQTTMQGRDRDGALAYLNATGDLMWSSYLGASGGETVASGLTPETGLLYLYGFTSSSDFPTTSGAFDESYNGGDADAFLARMRISNVVANDDAAETDAGTAVAVHVVTNDYDLDDDALTISDVGAPANGTAAIQPGGEILYTPDAGFGGTDSFTYTVGDGEGNSAQATVTVTVTGINQPPVAVNDSGTTEAGGSVTVDVLANDSDPDGDTLTVTGVSDPPSGTAVDNGDGTVTYTAAAGFSGTDTFTYTVSDGEGNSDQGTVQVTVEPPNQPPNAQDDAATTPEDVNVVIEILSNDSDPEAGPLTVTAIGTATHGVVTYNPDKTVTYAPALDWHGVDSFTYTIEDGEGLSDSATVTVTVTPVNDAPVAMDDTATTDLAGLVTIDVLANDSDIDGDTLTIVSISDPADGVVTDNGDGTITYGAAVGFSGTDSFTYTIEDPSGAQATATVTVELNQPVTAEDDTAATDMGAPVTIEVLLNDDDPDGDTLSIMGFTQGAFGTVTDAGGGTLTYQPNGGSIGTDTFTYTVSDGRGSTDTATVTVDVWVPFGPEQLSYTESDGTDVQVLLRGGTGRALLAGSGLTAALNRRMVEVSGSGDLQVLELEGTNDRSLLLFRALGGNGLAEVGTIHAAGGLSVLSGATVDLTGEGLVLGGEPRLVFLHDLKGGADILVAGGGGSGVGLRLNEIGADSDLSMAGSNLNFLIAAGWDGGTLEAQSISTLLLRGSMRDVTVAATGDVNLVRAEHWLGGSLSGRVVRTVLLLGDGRFDMDIESITAAIVRGTAAGNWNVADTAGRIIANSLGADWEGTVGGQLTSLIVLGDAGDADAAQTMKLSAGSAISVLIRGSLEQAELAFTEGGDQSLLRLDVSQWTRGSRIESAGGIGMTSFGALESTTLQAGVSQAVVGLPAAADAFVANAEIGRVIVRGTGRSNDFNVAASALGVVTLTDVAENNGGNPFGLATTALRVVQVRNPGGNVFWRQGNDPAELDLPGDGEIRLL